MPTAPDDLPEWATGNYPAGSDTWSATPRRVATGIDAFAADGLIPNEKTDAQSFNEWLARVKEWIDHLYSTGTFGDGSDGDLVIDGTSETISRSMYYNDLTIQNGGRLNGSGYYVHVRGTLTITDTSTLDRAGLSGTDGNSGGAGGNALTSAAQLGDSAAGGNGGTNGAGVAGGSTTSAFSSASTGGVGGGAGAFGTAASGTRTVMAAPLGSLRNLTAALTGHVTGNGSLTRIRGSAGGGGGAGSTGSTTGGGGGGGAGVLGVAAHTVVLSGTGYRIHANGGNGGDGNPAADAGGGGGGQGGLVLLVCRSLNDEALVGADGGTGGTASGGGTNGTDGADGDVLILYV